MTSPDQQPQSNLETLTGIVGGALGRRAVESSNVAPDPSVIGNAGWQDYYKGIEQAPAPEEPAKVQPPTDTYFRQVAKEATRHAVPPVIGRPRQ
ncbi:MAG TPA: hypothetical protein VLF43_00880 [Candidatus Saccharimonadales bacterium]|nr:hypothetical protein [Candidatus Saccharimonadales bacterium]